MTEQDDLIHDFLVESHENLDRLDSELVALEEDPGDVATLSSIFRTIHTIKGACGFLEFARLERVTHVGENLLSALRDGVLRMDDEIASVLLELVDAVREILGRIEQDGDEGRQEYADLIRSMERLREGGAAPAETPQEAAAPAETQPAEAAAAASAPGAAPAGDAQDEPASAGKDARTPEAPAPAPSAAAAGPSGGTGRGAGDAAAAPRKSVGEQNIRIQVEQLDQLMNLAGELVLARNQMLQHTAGLEDAATMATAQRLNMITTELQEGIMKIRMQPIGMLWSKFPRVVRDLARACGKRARLEMEGKETELDKSLLEAIKDPLTHLVRNAIDHGIDTPEARAARGEPEEGTLLLRAYHESGQVVMEVTDDGQGIDPTKVAEKAVEKGLITRERAAQMSDRQVFDLIFQPGFSTAAKVTNVSGRGVGMDVVRTNIERCGGAIDVESQLGQGTTIRIRIPLTLAIIPALTVTGGGDRYAIPQVNLVELVRLNGEDARSGIEDLHGAPFYRLRGRLLPLAFLRGVLEMPAPEEGAEEERDCINIVVLQADDRHFGLVVDEINDTEEIVVKPLDKQLKSVPVYAGTTIMGDGRVALILDVMGLADRANVLQERGSERFLEREAAPEADKGDARTFLMLAAGGGRRMAIELDAVSRLEKIPAARVEKTGGLDVVQYRDEIMPLVPLHSLLSSVASPAEAPETLHVVVHSRGCGSVGIVVDSILDIVESTTEVRRPSREPGIEAAAVIADRVTDILDIDELLERHGISIPEEEAALESASKEQVERTRQLCTFEIRGQLFGVDVMQVQEVLRPQEMTRVPLSPSVVDGLINLRGQTVTALDMRERLEVQRGPDWKRSMHESRDPMNVVVCTSGGEVSILVDRVGDVLTVSEDQFEPTPVTVPERVRGLLTGVYKLPERLLMVLDIERVVAVGDALEPVA